MATPEAPPPSPASLACTLPYPDRWHAAANFVAHPPPGACVLSDEQRLLLHALHQQASVGPCTGQKPWGWNVVEAAKHDAWSQLGNMTSMEAMRLYVKALEEPQPDWWTLTNQRASGTPRSSRGSFRTPAEKDPSVRGGSLVGEPGVWNAVQPRGKPPAPRYEHAVASLGGSMFVVGGNCGGRYLGDVWALHMDSFLWENVQTSSAVPQVPGPFEDGKGERPHVLPPCAGHVLVPWGSSLLCIGGHTKAKDRKARMGVWVLDKGSLTWSKLCVIGEAPPLRGAHTATLIGSRIYIFGGEDFARRPQSDLYILDMADTAWRTPDPPQAPDDTATPVSTPPSTSISQGPSARSAHVAACVAGRFLLIFGGGSVAHCFNDLWCLDTQTMAWHQPGTSGEPPCPRAGHAADVLDGRWYIGGGGNNAHGCTDLVSLDISSLGGGGLNRTPLRWEAVATSALRDPVASEGLSLLAAPAVGCLVAFGGYNGKYHNSVATFRPKDISDADSAAQPLPPSTSAAVPSSPMKQRPAGSTSTAAAAKAPAQSGDAHAQAVPLANGDASANGNTAVNKLRGSQLGNTASPHAAPPRSSSLQPSGRRSLTQEESRLVGLTAEVEAARAEAAAAKESAAMELAVLRHQLAKTQQALAQAEQGRDEANASLADAQGRVFKLEVAVAEGAKQAQQVAELEKELARYRKLAEEEAGQGRKRASTGLWGYISGAPAAPS
ncbi:hypothetical protein WJX73_009555 [Symbiochloris irregularis]|uniref:ACB domain-containing protein n=1 Tax=Symbiochloris irregularis TaxID=706552 RepID=A0AAW1PKA9_9CHLO